MGTKFTLSKKFKTTKKVVVITEEECDVELNEFVAIKIKELRVEKEMSQLELSKLIGLSRTSIVNIESGRHNISIINLNKFCEIFECKSSQILPF